MTAVAVEPRFTLAESSRILSDPTRDSAYQRATRLGSSVANYLAWKNREASERTLVKYELYLATLCVHVAPVLSTGGAKTPPPGLHQRPGGSHSCITSHRRGPSRAHVSTVGTFPWWLADIVGGAPVPLPAPLARRVRRVVHSSARGGGLARAPQPGVARRDADGVVDVRVGRWPGRSCGLVGSRAGLSGVPDLASGRRFVAGVDDGECLRAQVTA